MWRIALSAPVIIAAVAATTVAAAGGALTQLGPWYVNLIKPTWQPPNWAFPIAWTAIFACCAAAGAIAWSRLSGKPDAQTTLLVLFGLNAALNMGWSLLFFRLQRPDFALAEVALLWASIAHLIWFVRLDSPVSALLLAPYLVWVSFAALLNWEIVRLNAPFVAAP
jgi:translocator protein